MEAIGKALELIFTLDAGVFEIIGLTLFMTLSSTCVASVLGIPCGLLLGSRAFRGRKAIVSLANTFMGTPPVVVGLIVYLVLSRRGPLGTLELLFTPAAMIIAQTFLLFPLITSLSCAQVSGKADAVLTTCAGLGIPRKRANGLLLHECRHSLYTSVLAGYGRAVSEVGAVILVGGNIQHKTRVMTSAIVLETNKGNYEVALALGIILLLVAFAVNGISRRFIKT